MPKLLHFLYIFLSLLTGATFLYSAYTKVYPIQPFEYTIVEYLHLPWLFAAIGARVLIGIEAALGALILVGIYGRRKWVLKAALILLSIFSLYLIGLWVSAGNDVNCGCFGDDIWMSPSVSLMKNAALILFTILLIKYYNGLQFRGSERISAYVFAGILIIPFIINTIPPQQPSWLKSGKYKIDLTKLHTDDKPPIPYLSQGKHIIAFVSRSCPHCRMAAYKMHLMKKENPKLPFFLVIGGTTSDLTEFWKETKAQNIPYTRLSEKLFMEYASGSATGANYISLPYIVWVNNGWVEAKADYSTLNKAAIEKWLGE
jgi:hypothetical protein